MNRCATCTDYSKTTVPPRISNASPCASHCIQCLLTAPATLSGAPRPTRHDNRSNAKRTRTSNKTTHLEHITESIRLIPNREQEPCGLCPLSALTSPLMPRPRRAAAPHVCTYVLPQSPTPSTMTSFSQIRTPGPPAITSDRASPPHPTHAAAPFPCQQCQPARPRALLVQMTCARLALCHEMLAAHYSAVASAASGSAAPPIGASSSYEGRSSRRSSRSSSSS